MSRSSANVLAVRDPDPARLAGLRRAMEADGEFTTIWQPAPGWAVARARVTGDREDVAPGLTFVEGEDRLREVDPRGERVIELAERAPERLDGLPGDFGFLRFTADAELIAVRSCGGLVPLYWWQDGDRAAVASRLEYLPRFLDRRFAVDALASVLLPRWPVAIDGRTVLQGVRILARGSGIRIGPDGRASFVYWDPRPTDDRDVVESEDHARELRRLLVEALDRDLGADGGNLIALSGGVDSSALAFLAAGVLSRPLASLSLLPGRPETLERELSYIEPAVETLHIAPAHRITIDQGALIDSVVAPPPTVSPVIHPVLLALPALPDVGSVRVLLGGEDADPIVGHHQSFDDWANEMPPWGLRPSALPSGTRDYLRWVRARVRRVRRRPPIGLPERLPPMLHDGVYAEVADLRRSEGERARRDNRPLRQLAERLRQDAWLAMSWEATSPLGMHRCVPFQTREVLELAFRSPARERLGPGTKKLLRRALAEDVPPRHLHRADKGGFGRVVGDEAVVVSTAVPHTAAGLLADEYVGRPFPALPAGDALDVLHVLPAARWLQKGC